MHIEITITESEIREMISEHLRQTLGDDYFDPKDVTIEVKSKQNYKSEWEVADFRVKYKKF